MTNNYIHRSVEEVAFDESLTSRHMVFIAGPRQAGKTLLAQNWLKKKGCSSLYFNWDDISNRQAFRADSRFFESSARSLGLKDPWIGFDEIHKRNRWRDILKGIYDRYRGEFRFLITGSARLDLFRRSGDSLIGRYNLFHLMPLSIREITHKGLEKCFLEESDRERLVERFEDQVSSPSRKEITAAFEALWVHGPFPEPFLKQNDRFSRKWHQDYRSLVARQELREISRLEELDKVENLIFLLPDRVMSPLSMANLARELEAAHTTVKNWLHQLRRLYLIFSVEPWSHKISRGMKKEKKWYFLNWYYVSHEPARLENMVAAGLYRACLMLTDMGYGDYRLHYVKTLDKKEIDFVVTADHQPIMAVEVKTGDLHPSNTLVNRRNWFPGRTLLGIQVVDKQGVLQKYPDHTWVISADRFLSLLV